VLCRDDDSGTAHRLAVLVLQRELALRIGLEQRRLTRVARVSHHLQHVVRILDRRRHQLRGLVRRVAEHDALVARAFILVAGGFDALRDVGGLAVQVNLHLRLLPVEALLRIADVLDGLACELLGELLVDLAGLAHDFFRTGGLLVHANFAGEHDEVRRHERFARDLRHRIGAEELIDDRVGDPVADLVGMAFRDGLAREQVIAAHAYSLPGIWLGSALRAILSAP
jgi:hypothetical protein